MRIRSIHPDALKSKKLRDATPEAERLYWRLQLACDDDGRCEDDPDVLAHQLFLGWRDITPQLVHAWLWILHDLGLIVRYCCGDVSLIEVTQWSKYQHPQHPKPSVLPKHVPGTERIHERSPDYGEDNLLRGVELSGDEREMRGSDVGAFVDVLSPQDVVDEQMQRSGAEWRSRCADAMQVGRHSARAGLP